MSPRNQEDTTAIGQRFADLRKERGITQVELAARLGMSQNAISAYERGKVRINAPTLRKLADVLGVSADVIIGRTPPKKDVLPSRRLLRRAQRIEQLPERKQQALLQTIDAFLKASGA